MRAWVVPLEETRLFKLWRYGAAELVSLAVARYGPAILKPSKLSCVHVIIKNPKTQA